MLAVAGGAWALFSRPDDDEQTAIGTTVPTSAPGKVFGPVAPGARPSATVTATSTTPVTTPAAATSAPAAVPATATSAPTSASPAAVDVTPAPTATPKATASPVAPPKAPTVSPPVTRAQQGGTVAKKAYTFRVARGDTLWTLAQRSLAATGRSTGSASVASFLPRFYAANAAVVGSDPDLILPGQTITWPAGL